ncbi:iron transporter [Microtetraspora sp. NBRC 13810]|uniref:IucA/IucC family protein n=1 Tax=Microtetraspora sp. NBRC 13810 TaxID=3030990 RepID=UPI0024A2C49A|nr:IucA/IucC family protein [Microtetraspora sp. NBRC 13810]GLW07567.1 iron transporter [Microtetraspora sp. NBRC 13810]
MDSLVSGSPVTLAEEATLAALLRCCARELAGPGARTEGPYLTLRLAGTRLRVPAGGGLALRFTGPAEWLDGDAWRPLGVDRLVRLVETELSTPDGGNEEFAGQVAASQDAIAAMAKARLDAEPPADPWLASEQALLFGHPFHPAPKARGGDDWLAYAPEAHAAFPLRLLAVRDDVVVSRGETAVLDGLGDAPPGYTLLPAHPWQVELLGGALAGPLGDGRLLDLGDGRAPVTPTSSVRTVFEPESGTCLKFSLNVRITNCVRKNAWYELEGAVALTALLDPVFRDLSARFPGTRWLPEPGYRSAGLGTALLEGLGVIIRTGPRSAVSPGVTPVLSGALAAGHLPPACRADPVAWWTAYVRRVALPALDAYLTHGVVLEPHLQNVLVGLDADGLPAEAVFRDLEGTKLLPGPESTAPPGPESTAPPGPESTAPPGPENARFPGRPLPAALPAEVRAALTYDAERGWNRVAYCLFVNHLAEIAATVAHGTGLLPELWATAGRVLTGYAEGHGRAGRLRDLLGGAPLPAKANLSVRWARSADRAAGYVPIGNPLRPSGTSTR